MSLPGLEATQLACPHVLPSIAFAFRGPPQVQPTAIEEEDALVLEDRAAVTRQYARAGHANDRVLVALSLLRRNPRLLKSALRKKYGPPPPMPRSEARRRLTAHYATADPSMLAEVDDVLDDYTGRYGDLFVELRLMEETVPSPEPRPSVAVARAMDPAQRRTVFSSLRDFARRR